MNVKSMTNVLTLKLALVSSVRIHVLVLAVAMPTVELKNITQSVSAILDSLVALFKFVTSLMIALHPKILAILPLADRIQSVKSNVRRLCVHV